jgi:hypothetical protein
MRRSVLADFGPIILYRIDQPGKVDGSQMHVVLLVGANECVPGGHINLPFVDAATVQFRRDRMAQRVRATGSA